jgi:aryl-alcohol dehydrogenase (NADP+)
MSFGTAAWNIELPEAEKVVKKAIDLGINFFDTANVYSRGRSEEIVGECLKGRRDDMVIATKVYSSMGSSPNDWGLSRRNVMQQIKASLKRLQTDHIDLYQMHRWDYTTPIEETLRVFNDLVRQGMTQYIGASSMWAWQFQKALYTSERLGLERFVSMQDHYNLMYREEEREMIPFCKSEGVAIITWSPLARGYLTGKYRRGEKPKTIRYETDMMITKGLKGHGQYFKPDYDIVDAVEAVAKEKGVSPSQVALAWLLNRGVTAPIIGATKVSHVEEAAAAVDVRLNDDDMKRLEANYKLQPVIGHSYDIML